MAGSGGFRTFGAQVRRPNLCPGPKTIVYRAAGPQFVALSWQQRQGFELLTGSAEASEMIDRRAGRGEHERLERFGEHAVQIGFGADT
jgi:hypothetical protein